MKTKDLIIKLAALDPEADVIIAIKQYNKVNPVAYSSAFDVQIFGNRIYCALPDNVHTVERKVAA
tara:strand:+ start:281 stop:475 length:195 start_codon:yes stop_codon:yes gene_type:complete